ncbi:glycosyltransferase [Sphingomonas faeni]|uniref:glycosyltransferase n=1 Tax=Sphingomonas faeni TaxID=185950 RepID=UPI0027823328|nr:glycosyltransferase [Sphingomonas faeni]MDQ0838828.1 glycosyltransferase involved in cell wall biosynthesis [Sphingomonas faeni]
MTNATSLESGPKMPAERELPPQSRIVHVITRFIRGGADENTLFTCNGQAAQGHDVHLITGRYHPEMVAGLDSRVHWHFVPSLVRDPSLQDLACVIALSRKFRELKPLIVHTHESKAGILGRLAACLVRVPLIIHGVHILPFLNMSGTKRLLYLGMEKAVAPFTDAFLSVSEEMQRICIVEGLGKPDRHFWVPSGMDTEQYRQAEKLDWSTILPEGRTAVGRTVGLIAGHLEKRKQIGDLVEALGVYSDRQDWMLVIAGEGPEHAALQARIGELNLVEHVIVLGFRKDLPNLLVSADIVLHAAGNEGLPRVVVQATLAGRPVVTPALPGIDKVVADQRNGLFCAINDFPALAANFIALVDNPARRDSMAAVAREVDLSPWGINAMVKRINEAYKKALSSVKTPS